MKTQPTRDQFLGCLLGQAVGDALGAPFEGLSADNIFWGYGSADQFVRAPDEEVLYYTDDTQMMIGVAETLVERGAIVEAELCKAFVENYHPDRCYGQGARRVLEAMAADEDWRTLAATQFPGGSLGNGAAMRAAPIGLYFAYDLERVAEETKRSALPTHIHPIGIEGAQIFARAIALASRTSPFDRRKFYRALRLHAATEEFQWHLSIAEQLRPGDSLSGLGNSLEAHRSVVTAIACFASHPDSYEDTIATAIGLGNDTDTLAAMAGALSGAYLGVRAIPQELLDKLEDNQKGRTYILELANRLWERRGGSH